MWVYKAHSQEIMKNQTHQPFEAHPGSLESFFRGECSLDNKNCHVLNLSSLWVGSRGDMSRKTWWHIPPPSADRTSWEILWTKGNLPYIRANSIFLLIITKGCYWGEPSSLHFNVFKERGNCFESNSWAVKSCLWPVLFLQPLVSSGAEGDSAGLTWAAMWADHNSESTSWKPQGKNEGAVVI